MSVTSIGIKTPHRTHTINDTDNHTGLVGVFAFQAIGAAVIASATFDNDDGVDGDFDGVTLTGGAIYYLFVTQIQLTSGEITLLKAPTT